MDALPQSQFTIRDSPFTIVLIAAAFVGAACWIHPLRDVPIIDDWTYAWSVDHLLRDGTLRIADISAVYAVAQIGWGALFARLFGFSFGVLRVSTLVLAAVGCVAVYFTLRELRCSRWWSVAGALALAVHPVYFALAFSFMTDVPVTAVSLVALLFIVQAAQRDDPRRLWIAAAFAVAAFLIRATAIIVPLSAIVAIPWRRHRLASWVAPVAAACAGIAASWWITHHVFGTREWESGRFDQLQWVLSIPFRDYLDWNLRTLWQTSAAFAPLLLAGAAARRGWKTVAIAIAAVGALSWIVVGVLPLPMPDWSTWSLQDIGGGRVLIGGAAPSSAWSVHAAPVVIAIGLVAASAMAIALITAMGAAIASRGLLVVLAQGVLGLGVVNVLWLYNDRYYLILVPTLVIVVAWWASRVEAVRWLAAVLLAALFAVSVTGTRDMLDVNEVADEAVHQLEAAGVPTWEIDAGWALNGWRLWAHPERLAAGASRDDSVPFVTSKADTAYRIASEPHPGYVVVRTLPLPHAWWQATDRVFVLRRESPSPP